MLTYIDAIPAKAHIRHDEALNVLGGVANDAQTVVTADISVWGRALESWEPLVTQRVEIQSNEHKHLYFTLGPECFCEDRWGEDIEEIELIISDHEPEREQTGVMVFVE